MLGNRRGRCFWSADEQIQLSLNFDEKRFVEYADRHFVGLVSSRVFKHLAQSISRFATRSKNFFSLQQQCKELQHRRVDLVGFSGRIRQCDEQILRGQLQGSARILLCTPRFVGYRPRAKYESRFNVVRVLARQNIVANDLPSCFAHQMANHSIVLCERAARGATNFCERMKSQFHCVLYLAPEKMNASQIP